MLPTYASFRNRLSSTDFTVTTISGNSSLTGDLNVFIQFENRAGRNLPSEARLVTVNSGQGIRVTLPAGLIKPGEEVFRVVISISDDTEQNAVQVASWQARDSNQITRRSLPVTIDLTTNEHFKTNRTVDSAYDLPTSGMKNGAIALVVDSGKYYQYDAESYISNNVTYSYGAIASGHGKWIEHSGTFTSYLNSTTNNRGSDRRLSSVDTAINTPPKIGNVDGTSLRVWLNNGLAADGQSPIVSGRYTLNISVDGLEGYESVFANKVKYTLIGYCDRATGILDTTILTAGQQKLWNPTNGLIVLPQELPRNHAAVYDLALSFSTDEMVGILPPTASIGLDIVEVLSVQGTKSDLAEFLGDIVYSDLDRLAIVPGLKRLSGKASIKEGFLIDDPNEQMITGAIADTPNQKVVMSGALNGYCLVRQGNYINTYSEVTRASVSTSPGVSQLVQSDPIVLDNEGLLIAVNHPIVNGLTGKVRLDYPDSLIAGNTKSLFTPTKGYIYLQVGATTYRSPLLSVTTISSQTFSFTDLTDFTTISSLPTQDDAYFCLFTPDSVSRAAIAGSITGNVTAYFAYVYESNNLKATRINHSTTGLIKTATYPLADTLGSLTEITSHLTDLDNPHQVTVQKIGAASQADLNTVSAAIATQSTLINLLATKSKVISSNYTVQTSDYRTIISVSSATDVVITLDQSNLSLSSVPGLFEVLVRKVGAGNVLFQVPAGTTLESSGDKLLGIPDSASFTYRFAGIWAGFGALKS